MPPATRRGGVRPQRCTGTEQCICAFCADAQGDPAPDRVPADGAVRDGGRGPAGDTAAEGRQAGSTGSTSAEQQLRRSRGPGSRGHEGVNFGQSPAAPQARPTPSLVNLCLFRIALELPDLLAEDGDTGEDEGGQSALNAFCLYASLLPTAVKQSLAALARRQHVLTDEFLINGVLDSAWRVLDVSDSAASDAALAAASRECPALEAVSVRKCEGVSSAAIASLLKACPNIEHMRLGGSEACNRVARRTVRAILRGLLPPSALHSSGSSAAQAQPARGSRLSTGGAAAALDSAPSPEEAETLSAQDTLRRLSLRSEAGAAEDSAEAALAARSTLEEHGASLDPSSAALQPAAAGMPQDVPQDMPQDVPQDMPQVEPMSESGDGGWESLARDEGIALRGIAPALRTLVWPEIDDRSERELALRCPRIRVNPGRAIDNAAMPALRSPAQAGSLRTVPALLSHASAGPLRAGPELEELDEQFVAELDAQLPALSAFGLMGPRAAAAYSLSEAKKMPAGDGGTGRRESIAERFRLAYVEREERLAPKRAKNTRQHMRKEAQEMLAKSPWAKAQYWAHRVHTQA